MRGLSSRDKRQVQSRSTHTSGSGSWKWSCPRASSIRPQSGEAAAVGSEAWNENSCTPKLSSVIVPPPPRGPVRDWKQVYHPGPMLGQPKCRTWLGEVLSSLVLSLLPGNWHPGGPVCRVSAAAASLLDAAQRMVFSTLGESLNDQPTLAGGVAETQWPTLLRQYGGQLEANPLVLELATEVSHTARLAETS